MTIPYPSPEARAVLARVVDAAPPLSQTTIAHLRIHLNVDTPVLTSSGTLTLRRKHEQQHGG